MTSKDLIEACDTLLELEKEFAAEESKLADVSNERYIKIEEIDHQILTLRRNEDVDFRVFSPRNTSTANSEKIRNLEEEKKILEREKKDADRQLSYYSGKTEKINKVIRLLRGELGDDTHEENLTVRKSRNPFAFLDEVDESDNSEKDETEFRIGDYVERRIVLEDAEESPISRLINEKIMEDLNSEVKDNPESEEELEAEVEIEVEETASESSSDTEPVSDSDSDNAPKTVGVPVDEVERVCHKVEFSAKIINNDHIRARMELKEIVSELKEIIRVYRK